MNGRIKMMENEVGLPLEGIKVVEFTHMVMGPATGVILGDLGATVIKVEPPGGDKTRRLKGSGAGYFPMYNRNKQSVCIDMKTPEGLQIARDLAVSADVVIENFRPGAMDKLGLGYQALSELNPQLIYCSLKGFLGGPYEKRTALDEVTQMMGGLAYMTGLPDRPMRAGSSVIDITGGMFGVIGILAGLEERHRTGKGKRVTSSLYETTAFMVGQHMAQQVVLGAPAQPMSVRQSAWAIYDIFKCANDEQLFIGVVSDVQWRSFCEAFGLTEFAQDTALESNAGRVEHRARIHDVLNAMFATMDKDALTEKLEAIGLPFAPINKPSDLFDDPHLNAGGLLDVTFANGEQSKLPALPIEMDEKRLGIRYDIPREGENYRAVLTAMGYQDADIDRLVAEGVIQSA